MKRLLTVIFAITVLLQMASAQALDVVEFRADGSDLSAVVHQKTDLNGDPCALVKVGLAVANATFEGDIISAEQQDGEYWVYMVNGANWLTIKTSEYTPLRIDNDFGPLKSNTTYILTIRPKPQTGEKPDILPIELPAKSSGVSIGGITTAGTKPVRFNMIKVKNGTFKMGATPEQMSTEDDENPVHRVSFTRDFYIGETEVTQALWQYVMDENPSFFKDDDADLPVERISWDEAQTFCRRLSQITGVTFRLPTEAEWEYAARGGHKATTTRFAGSNDVDDAGWYSNNSSGRTHDVKSKKPNELGLYNMSGNVWEICEDYKNPYSKDDAINPVSTKVSKNKNRVRRGGAWDSEDYNQLRISYRRRLETDAHFESVGLRLVLEL
jgi:formylglycine-generating enzyme required for sulfatase activity